jgi:hypothetical protein
MKPVAAAAAAAAEVAAAAAEAALAAAAEAESALAAEAAEADLAEVAAAEADLAGDLAAEAAARRGELAAGARPDRFPTYFVKRRSSWPGSTRSARPIHIYFAALPAHGQAPA